METVLVIEDEISIRKLAVFLLRDAGYQVVDFATADEGMAYAASADHQIDTIFTDVQTPGETNGFDLAKSFLDARPKASVVVTSGKHDFVPDESAKQIVFIPKPWSVNDLLGAVGYSIRH